MTPKPADADFIARLTKDLPAGTLRPADPRYLEEPRGKWTGQPTYVALPRSTAEVSTIVAACHAAHVPVMPYAGGTGLVGGQISQSGPAPLILSLERMTAIRAVYPAENVLVAEAGAILTDVQAAADEANRLFPLSLASEGSARIGGLLGTNAGGVNVLRYGNARDLCLGLEAVLPDGQIWNGLKRLRKDNTGYDLRNLLIGSEGTLGVITAATLKLSPRPARTATALMVVEGPQSAVDLLSHARDIAGEAVSAFELIDGTGLRFLAATLPDIRLPFADAPNWVVLIELGVSAQLDPNAMLETLFETGMEAGLVSDGLIAQSQAQRDEFWSVREHIPEANKRVGAISSQDISVPISLVPAFIEEGFKRMAEFGPMRINSFGHLGDGNLHFNIFAPEGQTKEDYTDQSEAIRLALHDLVHEMDGSISAEHGIGRLKVKDLEIYGDPVKLAAMRQIKQALDPHGIMNPGAVLRA
ncbi:FAD-binding oxidoreductase [Pseudoprimorskyibacter insulae]|uniref:Putative FAD-linked oxidoreductase n=1 Tax=Pseudoprimorskyibacter insulae TaxID=1695997 RepID=A0A2R8AYL4_9RHOB|nr:FAD-binding oxidoreductase [Pseudoprimorskyibacter insulae]SPF80969.1 putative FAD-linked oxidoreductase [Pseudoprimorskyibacter insulae]